MRCQSCGTEISIWERRCPYCLASATPLLDGAKKGSEAPGPRGGTGRKQGFQQASSRSKALWRLGNLGQDGKAGFSLENDFQLFVSRQELFQISQMVMHCPHVQSNELYSQRAKQTTLVFLEEQDQVNAFAVDFPLQEISAEPPLIVLFQGLCRACRLIALGLGLRRAENSNAPEDALRVLIREIGRSMLEQDSELSLAAAESILGQMDIWKGASDTRVLQWCRSYNAAMNMGVISHELGHIALGHTLGIRVNSDVSRNQEREADSFAASVISSSPFADYMVEGMIFFWILLAWARELEHSQEALGEITHPEPRERLFDFIRANRELAETIGLGSKKIEGFLP
ncbi:MAG: hypothetical protein ACOCY9_00490 [Desulfohalobiaceae bacterium]